MASTPQANKTGGFPRITYHAASRTFDRLFKEKSLAETKAVVRRKLGIAADVDVSLTQLRDNIRIDLDDDGDFEAFKAVLRSTSHVNVLVAVEGESRPDTSDPISVLDATSAPGKGKRKNKKRRNSVSAVVTAVPPRLKTPVSESRPSDSESVDAGPKRKKRKVAFDETAETPLRVEAAPSGSVSYDSGVHAKAPALNASPVKVPAKKIAHPAGQSTLHDDAKSGGAKVSGHKRNKSQTNSTPDVTPEPSSLTTGKSTLTGVPLAIPGQRPPPPQPIFAPHTPAPIPASPVPDAQPAERKRKRKRDSTPESTRPVVLASEHSAEGDDAKKRKKTKKSKKGFVDGSMDSTPIIDSLPATPARPSKKLKVITDSVADNTDSLAPASQAPEHQRATEDHPTEEPSKRDKKRKKKAKSRERTAEGDVPSSTAAASELVIVADDAEPVKVKKPRKLKAVEVDHAEASEQKVASETLAAGKDSKKVKAKPRKPKALAAGEAVHGDVSADANNATISEQTTAPVAVEATPAKAKRQKSKAPEVEKASSIRIPQDAIDRDTLQSMHATSKGDADSTERKKRGRKSKAAEPEKPRDETSAAADTIEPDSVSMPDAPPKDKVKQRKSKAAGEIPGADVSASAPSAGAELSSSSKKAAASKVAKTTPHAPLTESEVSAFRADLRALAHAAVARTSSSSSSTIPAAMKEVELTPSASAPAVSSKTASAPPPEGSKASALKKKPSKSRLSISWVPGNANEAVTVGPSEEAVAASPEEATAESLEETTADSPEEATADSPEAIAPKPASPEKSAEQPTVSSTAPTPPRRSVPQALEIAPVPDGISLGSVLTPSTPTLPAGTTISEVTIQGQDEGSSNDGSDEDEEDGDEDEAAEDAQDEHVRPVASQPTSSLAPPLPNTAASIEEELEAIIAGPQHPGPRRSVLDEIPMESASNTEEESETENVSLMEDEDDEQKRKAERRRSKIFFRERSSSAEAPGSDGELGFDDPTLRESPMVYMDGSHEVPPPEPSPSPFGLEDLEGAGTMADEQSLGQPMHPPVEGSVPSDKASEDSAPTIVDGNASDKALEASPTPAPIPVSTPDEREKVAETGRDQHRSASPESDMTVKGIENADEQQPPKEDAADAVDPPATTGVSTLGEDHVEAQQEPTSPATASQQESPVDSAAASSQTDPSTPQPSVSATKDDDMDPIQPADDFERRTPVRDPDEDPIEMDLTQHPPSPLNLTPKPGTVKRMKDRNGRAISQGAGSAVLASQISEASESGGPVTRRSGRLATRPPPSQSQPPATQAEAESTAAPAPAPKRRGRVPMSEEEKAARAAAKQAEKEEKARLRQEKAAAKKAEKAAKKAPAKPASKRGAKASAQPEPEPAPAQPLEEQEHDQPSIAEWKALTPASPVAPSDVSAIDQLRSSSPGLGDHPRPAKTGSVLPPSSEAADLEEGREISAVNQLLYNDSSQPDLDSEDFQRTPLFLPGSSQFPMSQPPNKILHASPHASSGSEDEGVTPVARTRKPTTGKPAPYRRLTELAKKPLFTSPSVSSSKSFASRPAPKKQPQDVFGAADEDDDEEGSSSGSDSDAETKSHIPKNRRAGGAKKPARRSSFFSRTQ